MCRCYMGYHILYVGCCFLCACFTCTMWALTGSLWAAVASMWAVSASVWAVTIEDRERRKGTKTWNEENVLCCGCCAFANVPRAFPLLTTRACGCELWPQLEPAFNNCRERMQVTKTGNEEKEPTNVTKTGNQNREPRRGINAGNEEKEPKLIMENSEYEN